MSNQVPNAWKSQLWKGYLSDTFKIILMQPGFTFDKDSHKSYSDVSAFELPNGNGYTTGGETLTGIARTTDDVEDRCEITWNNVQWNASGGSLSTCGAIIYNDSAAIADGYDYDDAIVAFIDAGGTITATDGTPIIISSIMITIEDV